MLRRGLAFVVQWTLFVAVTVTIVQYKHLWDHHVHGWGREFLALAVWLVLSGIVFLVGSFIRGGGGATRTGTKS